LEDKLVATKLAKKTKGWRRSPDGAIAIEECVYVPRDKQLRQEIIMMTGQLDTQGDTRCKS
jgi:hypothetical protein